MSEEQYDLLEELEQRYRAKFVAKELKRLKGMLEEAGIPFEYEPDYQTERLKKLYPKSTKAVKAVSRGLRGDRIACPCHAIPVFSVIETVFSRGGEDDLLECWCVAVSKEPVGYLTAEKVYDDIRTWFEENNEDERKKIYEAVKEDYEKATGMRKRRRRARR
jgi:hypothetical protein